MPSTLADSVRFLLYDTESGSLQLVSESGYVRTIGEQVVRNIFAVSGGGSRVVYIRDNQNDTLRLIREDLIGLNEEVEVFRIPAGFHQQGPLSFAVGAGFGLYATVLNLHHADQPELNNFFILAFYPISLLQFAINCRDGTSPLLTYQGSIRLAPQRHLRFREGTFFSLAVQISMLQQGIF